MDGDLNVDAEHPREDGSGEFGGEGEQCGGAVLSGLQPDLLQAKGELVIADGLAWAAAGKEPGHVLGCADLGFAAVSGNEFADQIGQGLGHDDWRDDWRGAECDLDVALAEVDIVGGESTDGGDLLGIEDQEQAGDAVWCG
ncbi:hypothetical protein [Streptomyces sp. 8N616]|uniref:hypothetical protein n=1 Tax=Streptomyces sp. 8N616 TaxID=3457414 RepID=UPI003FD3EABB